MKPVIYKVETYFVPEVNKFPLPTTSNEIDHIKIANQPIDENTCESNTQDEEDVLSPPHEHYVETTCFVENHCKLFSAKILENLMKEEETECDNKFDNDNAIQNDDEENIYRFNNVQNNNNVQKTEFQISIGPQDTMYPVRQFKRINRLMSIDERSERSENSEGKFNDFCYHGYKNGCTATIPSPEEVSEEVFKENWLQKIEILRQREAIVTAREASLQSKERQLFKREKEVRIAERMVKEKLKQLEEQEQQLRQQRNMQNVEKRLEEVGRILRYDERNEFHEPLRTNKLTSAAKLSAPSSIVVPCERNPEKDPEKRPIRNLTRASSSRQLNSASGVHSYRSIRYKKKPKISYNDLDSTLSADIGDSSYVRTSALFNPEIYKKPYAFRRSASERWTKHRRYNTIDTKVQDFTLPNIEERPDHAIEEDKILQRLSENICATQDKSTTFQHYGLVDKPDDIGTKVKHNLECRFAHLDLETGNKDLNRRKPVVIASKNRPISWNDQASEWLQKKRQEYNSTIQKSAGKENLQCNTIAQKSGKKKDIKTKILTIFR